MMAENPQFGKDLNKFLRKSCGPAVLDDIHILSPLELQQLHRNTCAERGSSGGGVGEETGACNYHKHRQTDHYSDNQARCVGFSRYSCTRVHKALQYCTLLRDLILVIVGGPATHPL